MMRVAGLELEETLGNLHFPSTINTKTKQNDKARKEYDDQLRQYLVYHLNSNHKLPLAASVREQAMTITQILAFLAKSIEEEKAPNLPNVMFGKYLHHKSRIISLEIMFNTAVQQIRNELLLLEHLCSVQGYVYTFNPPAIFVRFFREYGTELLSRIHVAGLKYVASTTKLNGCKVFT